MKKLISFENFSKRTKTLKEGLYDDLENDDLENDLEDDDLENDLEDGVEEIIPEGPLDDDSRMKPKYNIPDTEKIEEIKSFIEDADDDIIEVIVNELRDVLLEMEQMGVVDEDTTDELDDEHGDDWISWINVVIELPDFPEEGLNNVLEIINNVDELEFGQIGNDEEDDVECLDCDGSGQDENGEDCERCDGTGRVYRPDDIPPDDFDEDEEDED